MATAPARLTDRTDAQRWRDALDEGRALARS